MVTAVGSKTPKGASSSTRSAPTSRRRGPSTKIGHLEDAPARERCQNVSQMTATKIKKTQRTRTGEKAKSEAPWNVILHNDWDNSMPRVVIVLKKVIPGMTFKRATAIMWGPTALARLW